MKKLAMTVAVLVCAASVVSAQVYSQNIVGYSKQSTANGLVIMSCQFDTGNNTPEGIFGDSLPVGSKIYKFDPATGYVGNIATYESVLFGGTAWNNAPDLGQSVGFWVETTDVIENIVAGTVYDQDSVTNSIVPGLQLLSYPYPVQRTLSQLNLTPTVGDKVYKYNPDTGYVGNIATYESVLFGGTAWNVDLTFDVGDGFWYESQAAGTVEWVEVRPF